MSRALPLPAVRFGSVPRYLAAPAFVIVFGSAMWGLALLGVVALRRPELPGAAWWPAAGLAVVVLVRTPRRWWPWLLAVAAAAVAVSDRLAGLPWAASVTYAIANAVECGVTASVFRGARGPVHNYLSRGADAARLAASASCGVGVATTVLLLRGVITRQAWVSSALAYAISHCLGLLMFTPVLLLLPRPSTLGAELRAWRVNLEWSAQIAVSIGLSWAVFLATSRLPLAFVVVFPLLWGAMRVGPARAMASTVAVSLVATIGTLDGHGPFAALGDHATRLRLFQLLLAAIFVSVLVLVLAAHTRTEMTEMLAEREASLAQAQALAGMGSWTWDSTSDALDWSSELFTLTGTDPATFTPTFADAQWLVVADDRDRVAQVVQDALSSGRPYEVDYRIQRPDGEIRVFHGRGRPDIDRHGRLTGMRGIAQDVTAARAVEAELTRARDLFAGVLDSATEQIIIGTDLQGRVTVFNVGAERLLGYRAEQMLGRLPAELHYRREIAARAAELGIPAGPDVFIHALRQGAHAETREWTYRTSDGHSLQVMLTVTAMRDSTGAIAGYIGVGTDVTEQRRAESALSESEQRFRLAFEASSVGMYMTSLDPAHPTRILRANQAMADLVGVPIDGLVGRTVLDITHPVDLTDAHANIRDLTSGRATTVRREKAFRHADGTIVWTQLSLSTVSADGDRYVIALAEDISARKQAEETLRQQSLHDPLTGLANRRLVSDRLEHALAAATRSDQPVGVVYIDLDGFKQVNDRAGHGAGDELLTMVARRLLAATRPGDTVGRLGGDEFAIICPDISPTSLQAVADRALAAMNAAFPLVGGVHHISASIGLAVSDRSSTADAMLTVADAGMYSAKKSGKNRVCTTPAEDQARAARTARLGGELHTAIDEDQFVLFGQPIIDLRTGTTVAVETLIRWHHPTRGLLTPAEFLDVAEQSPHMLAIGRRVLDESCRLAASWAHSHRRPPDVHVNISGRQLEGGHLLTEVEAALNRHGLPATRLVLELTESHMPAVTHSLRADLQRLRERGVRIAIDDLGTGFSSLARLTDLPVDLLKIDLSFIAGLGHDTRCEAIVRAVLSLGHTLNIPVVAEGVETEEQAQILRDFRCEQAQGYLYSSPRPEHQMRQYLNGSHGAGGVASRAHTSARSASSAVTKR